MNVDNRSPLKQRILRSDGVRFMAPLIVAIIAISLYTNRENGNFLGGDNLKNILLQVSVLGIIAIGQTLLIAAGQLDLSVATLAALAGVIGATRINDGGSELWAVVLVLLICALFGLLWGILVAGLKIPPFILTLGGTSLFASIALRISKSSPVPARERFEWLGRAKVFGVQTFICAVSINFQLYTYRWKNFNKTCWCRFNYWNCDCSHNWC